jgi:hypothetical protein
MPDLLTPEHLETLSQADLIDIAKKDFNLETKGNESKKSLVARILEAQSGGPVDAPEEDDADTKDEDGGFTVVPPAPPASETADQNATAPVTLQAQKDEILKAVDPFLKAGLHIRFDDKSWHMRKGVQEDSGTIHQPVLQIIKCARRLMPHVQAMFG